MGFSSLEQPLVLHILATAAGQLLPDTFAQWVGHFQRGRVTAVAAYTRQVLLQAALPVTMAADELYAQLFVCCGFLALHQTQG